MCEWGVLCYFWVSILPEAFHLVSVQEYIWFGRRCWLKNSKMVVQCMAIFDVWMGCFVLFLSLHIAGSLPSSFSSRVYMVWKKMLVEEFQDGCLVHGHLWCVNGMLLAISESPCCRKPSIKFLLKRIYGLEDVEEFQDGCLVHDHLLYLSGMKESFLSLFLALRIQSGFCSWGHMVRRKM